MARETARHLSIIFLLLILATSSCTDRRTQVDLVNNEFQREQAFQQILTHPQIFEEFINELSANQEAVSVILNDSSFNRFMFTRENLNRLWENNPGMDSAVIDNVTTRMLTDTAFHNQFNRRMGLGTPASR